LPASWTGCMRKVFDLLAMRASRCKEKAIC
jgi:hypothetical protein